MYGGHTGGRPGETAHKDSTGGPGRVPTKDQSGGGRGWMEMGGT